MDCLSFGFWLTAHHRIQVAICRKRKGETMLTTKAVFNRKLDDFEPKNCVIEEVIALTYHEYDKFSENMLVDYDYIKDNKRPAIFW